jgi:hypothetical protein
MDLAVELDFPETIVGSCHESSYRLAIVGSIVSGNSSDALLNAPGLTQKLGVSEVEHGPVGDRRLLGEINTTSHPRLPIPEPSDQAPDPARLHCEVSSAQDDDWGGRASNTYRPELRCEGTDRTTHDRRRAQSIYSNRRTRIAGRVDDNDF